MICIHVASLLRVAIPSRRTNKQKALVCSLPVDQDGLEVGLVAAALGLLFEDGLAPLLPLGNLDLFFGAKPDDKIKVEVKTGRNTKCSRFHDALNPKSSTGRSLCFALRASRLVPCLSTLRCRSQTRATLHTHTHPRDLRSVVSRLPHAFP